jgi:hypothetical protein
LENWIRAQTATRVPSAQALLLISRMMTLRQTVASAVADRGIGIYECGAVEHNDTVLVGDCRTQAADWLVQAYVQHLDLGGYRVTGPYGGPERPIDMEEHAAGTWQVLRDHCIE